MSPNQAIRPVAFHRTRAFISLTGLNQAFFARESVVLPTTLSQYLRCVFRGPQDLLKDKLALFIHEYLDGT